MILHSRELEQCRVRAAARVSAAGGHSQQACAASATSLCVSLAVKLAAARRVPVGVLWRSALLVSMYLRRSTNQHTHSTRFFGGSILDCIGSERAGGGCTGSWKKLRALVTLRMETARQAGLKLLVGCHGLSWAAGRAHTARGLSWAVASPYISRVGVDEKSLVCNRFAREVWASKDKCARRQAHREYRLSRHG